MILLLLPNAHFLVSHANLPQMRVNSKWQAFLLCMELTHLFLQLSNYPTYHSLTPLQFALPSWSSYLSQCFISPLPSQLLTVKVAISLHPTPTLTPPAHVAWLHFECLTEEGVCVPAELAPAHDAVIEPMSLVLGILPPWYWLSWHYWTCFQLLHMACCLLCWESLRMLLGYQRSGWMCLRGGGRGGVRWVLQLKHAHFGLTDWCRLGCWWHWVEHASNIVPPWSTQCTIPFPNLPHPHLYPHLLFSSSCFVPHGARDVSQACTGPGTPLDVCVLFVNAELITAVSGSPSCLILFTNAVAYISFIDFCIAPTLMCIISLQSSHLVAVTLQPWGTLSCQAQQCIHYQDNP